jgi:hypothetical protein
MTVPRMTLPRITERRALRTAAPRVTIFLVSDDNPSSPGSGSRGPPTTRYGSATSSRAGQGHECDRSNAEIYRTCQEPGLVSRVTTWHHHLPESDGARSNCCEWILEPSAAMKSAWRSPALSVSRTTQ